MRAKAAGQFLKVHAIAGTYVVILAWDFANAIEAEDQIGLLGFAIERTEFDASGQPVERYWMSGIKRFRFKDQGLPPGTPVSTAEHPVQSFLWADYTVHSGRRYEFRVVPLYGTPKLIERRDPASVAVTITTEIEYLLAPDLSSSTARHDVYFNRGVIGSQAYARRFGNREPDPADPTSETMVWLSRGLFEALLAFIDLAEDHRYSLHCAFYEFHYLPVALALTKAHDRGADVAIVYDAESSYKTENERVIRDSGLLQRQVAIPRTVTEGIRHNKFMVLSKDGQPIAVWTGSTNISAGGIFGHSNVGHIVWDDDVAKAYLEYWKLLAANTGVAAMRGHCRTLSPLPHGKPPVRTVLPVFSPRDRNDESTSLQWYADRMSEATQLMCITLAFNLDKVFQQVIQQDNDVLRFIVKDDDLAETETIGRDRDVLFATGAPLTEGALANFAAERGNPLNSNFYIHDKFMLVDPLGEEPLTVTGSANFSQPSQRKNDENMLVITGDARVADIYLGEFMRIFDHHYARYLVRKLTREHRHDPDAGYLKERTDEWLPPHFDPQSYKSKRRTYFG